MPVCSWEEASDRGILGICGNTWDRRRIEKTHLKSIYYTRGLQYVRTHEKFYFRNVDVETGSLIIGKNYSRTFIGFRYTILNVKKIKITRLHKHTYTYTILIMRQNAI